MPASGWHSNMLGEGLYTLLSTTSSITAIVAQLPDGTSAIFPTQMPEATPLPNIVLKQIAGAGDPIMEGVSGFKTARVQFSCRGHSYENTRQLAMAVRNLFDSMQATLPDGTEVDVAVVLLDSDNFEEAPFVYHAPVDVEFYFREPAAARS